MSHLSIPVVVLLVVFVLIAIRQVGNIKLEIWQIMLFGAAAVLITRGISPANALKAIDPDVLMFLFGMFIIGEALEKSGYLSHISYRLFKKAGSVDALVLRILFLTGIASAFLMNDTLAIIGTPLMILLAKRHNIHTKLLLLALAFAITTGSVMSPIGNPQNLLISINGNLKDPFVTFLEYLFVPTMINILAAYAILKVLFRNEFHSNALVHTTERIKDRELATLSKLSLIIIILLVVLKITGTLLHSGFDFRLTYIALLAALPVLLFSRQRFTIIKHIDWRTLVFFPAMFVLMKSVWLTGFFQHIIKNYDGRITSVPSVLGISVALSQLISNVPMVALYIPVLLHAGGSSKALIALAAGSTIAGNLLILGAASNVIIIQNAEKKTGETLTFIEFLKAGLPLTLINVAVYWFFLTL